MLLKYRKNECFKSSLKGFYLNPYNQKFFQEYFYSEIIYIESSRRFLIILCALYKNFNNFRSSEEIVNLKENL